MDELHPTYFPTSSLSLLTFLQFLSLICLFLNMALSLESLYYLHVGNPSFPPLLPALSSPSFLLSLHILSICLSLSLCMFMHMQVQACTCVCVYIQYTCMWRPMVKFRYRFSDTVRLVFPFLFFFCFLIFGGGWQCLSLVWSLPVRCSWLSSKSQGSSFSVLGYKCVPSYLHASCGSHKQAPYATEQELL